MKKQMLLDVFNNISPSDEQINKMLDKIQNTAHKTKHIQRPAKKFFMLAAVLTVLLTTTLVALAAPLSSWHAKLLDYFRPAEAQEVQLESAVNTPYDATIQNDGITITIKQTIADSQVLYVLYEMTVPPEIELTDHYRFEKTTFNVGIKDNTESNFTAAGYDEKILDQDKNQRTVLLRYDTNGIIEDQKLSLSFKNLQKHIDNTDSFETVINDEWSVSWDFNYEDTSKTIEVNETINVKDAYENDISIQLTEIRLSPLSISICYKTDKDESPARFIVNLNMKDNIIVQCDKNTKNEIGTQNKSIFQDVDGNGTLYYGFANFVDIENIESISICGNIISLNV